MKSLPEIVETAMSRPDRIIYATEATSTGGREGRAATADGRLDVGLSVPKEFGGPGAEGTNPEQLFAAGWSACFLSAIKLMGRLGKVAIPDATTVTAKIGVGAVTDGYVFTSELVIAIPGVDRNVAEELVAGAHQRCPFSRATRGNIDVVLTIRDV
jgi:Ohr subfamily peroxiredoxin